MMNSKAIRSNNHQGFSLLEVVLAIAIFATGMMALTHLQSNLAKSSGDANARSVATAIGEEIIEHRRAFVQVGPDPNGVLNTFAGIVDERRSYQPGDRGLIYDVQIDVSDYWFDPDRTRVWSPDDAIVDPAYMAEIFDAYVYPDFKYLVVDVNWSTNQEFEVDQDTTAQLGTGSIQLTQLIPSSPGLSSLMVSARVGSLASRPVVDFSPGLNPDIVRLTLDESGGKFKESSSPEPEVMRDEHVETWFDVVTYSQLAGAQATFLRREEFSAVTCDCVLETAPSAAEYGLKPTLWNGVDYTEGERVEKNIGIPVADEQQSEFCSVCCRDHHDGGDSGAEDVYRLSNVGNGADHAHYTRDEYGSIVPVPVGDGDHYEEACRLIRKDGFMRVTQDAQQGSLLGFPEGYLEFADGVSGYSDYVTGAVSSYYFDGLSSLPQPEPYQFPARQVDDATNLPTAYYADNQQLRARAVYADYLTQAAQDVIDACLPRIQDGSVNGAPATPECPAPYLSTELEVWPFFDLQMTYLARWNNESLSGLVTVTNEPIRTGNTHSRGLAKLLISDGEGQSRISITSSAGNLGLTATGPIDLSYTPTGDSVFIDANDSDTPAPPIGSVVSGPLRSSLRRVPAADLSLYAPGALCGQTDVSWACVVPAAGVQLEVGNYYLNNPQVYVCSDLGYVGQSGGTTKATATTTFTLPGSGDGLDIWVTSDFTVCER